MVLVHAYGVASDATLRDYLLVTETEDGARQCVTREANGHVVTETGVGVTLARVRYEAAYYDRRWNLFLSRSDVEKILGEPLPAACRVGESMTEPELRLVRPDDELRIACVMCTLC
jgi:hypothetical protein